MVTILATDRSPDALDLARENAVAHAVADRISFALADLVPRDDPNRRPFELVLANLPYVRHDAMAHLPVATSFEPAEALDGGPDGLRSISLLLARLPELLANNGEALLEIGGDQGEAIVAEAAEVLAGWSCSVEHDLAGLPRVARVRPP
jgi:release factor glutamine methyltransferase